MLVKKILRSVTDIAQKAAKAANAAHLIRKILHILHFHCAEWQIWQPTGLPSVAISAISQWQSLFLADCSAEFAAMLAMGLPPPSLPNAKYFLPQRHKEEKNYD